MRISYCFPKNPNLASWRYRIDIPSRNLIERGHACWEGSDGDIVYFAKHFDPDDLEIAEHCKSQGQKIAFDCCDDHFKKDIGNHYRHMIMLADVVTCPTETMQEIISKETNSDSVVISDPYEYPEAPAKPPGNKLFWFGHQSNIGTLKGLDINGYKLGVLTGDMWSYKNMLRAFSETDMVIIPSNPLKQFKSPNRMVESIRQGHYVVAGPMPAYEGYSMWIGDIKEGCDWAINHPKQVEDALVEAQEIVREKHSPNHIGAQWEQVFRSL